MHSRGELVGGKIKSLSTTYSSLSTAERPSSRVRLQNVRIILETMNDRCWKWAMWPPQSISGLPQIDLQRSALSLAFAVAPTVFHWQFFTVNRNRRRPRTVWAGSRNAFRSKRSQVQSFLRTDRAICPSLEGVALAESGEWTVTNT